MKQVIAIVRPYLAEKVLEKPAARAARSAGGARSQGLWSSEDYLDEYRAGEFESVFLPKVEILMWVEDFRVEEVIRRVTEVACSGRMGDGKVMVLPLTSYAGAEVIDI